jgi:hypothetical protein
MRRSVTERRPGRGCFEDSIEDGDIPAGRRENRTRIATGGPAPSQLGKNPETMRFQYE